MSRDEDHRRDRDAEPHQPSSRRPPATPPGATRRSTPSPGRPRRSSPSSRPARSTASSSAPTPPSRSGAAARSRSAPQIVGRAAELMLERKDEFAALDHPRDGQAHPGGRRRGAARRQHPRLLREERPALPRAAADRGDGQGEAVVENEPVGVILAIEPWNYPLYQVVRVAGPNLVLGNAILLKHAEVNPQTAPGDREVLPDAGVPEGVYTNALPGHPRRRAGHRRTRSSRASPSPAASGPAAPSPRSPAST